MDLINSKIRKGLAFLTLTALLVTGIYMPPAYAATADTEPEETVYYHLDMGVQMAYEGTEWTKSGYDWGWSKNNMTATVAFPQDVTVIDAYPLNSSKGEKFSFDGPTSNTNIPDTLKKEFEKSNPDNPEKAAYDKYYSDYVTTNMFAVSTPRADGNKVTFNYGALFKTTVPLDVVKYGKRGFDADVWKLFGGQDKVSNPDIRKAIQYALDQGRNGTAGSNKLYLVFCPTVIEYKKVAEVPVETTPGAITPGTTSGGGIDGNTPGLIDPGDTSTPDDEPSTRVCVALADRGYTGSCIDSASKVSHISGDAGLKALGQAHEYDSKFQYWKVTVKLSEYNKNGTPIVTTLKLNTPQREGGNSDKFTVTFPRVGTYKVYGSKWWYYEDQGMHTHYTTDSEGHKTKHCSFLRYDGNAAIEQHGAVGPYTVVITPKDVNRPIPFDENWQQPQGTTDTFLIE